MTTAGTCAVMGTASTMAAIAEALGMTLPGTAAIPAVHADRLRAAEATGARAVALARSDLTPDKIITARPIENAARVLLALGGSTNGVIHLAAIAGRLGLKLDLKRLNELSDTTPVLAAVKPVGNEFYMEDFFAAGGIGAVLRELKPLLHLDCMTITGETLGQRLAAEEGAYVDRRVIKSAAEPLEPQGGLVALFGSLAPDGAIIKRSAATPALFEKTARAVVFSSLEDMAARIDDPELDVTADDILVLQNAGPRSASAMPEAGFLPIPKKLLAAGVKDMVRISDARMSGTAYGTIVLHVAPEAAAGGPLALVRTRRQDPPEREGAAARPAGGRGRARQAAGRLDASPRPRRTARLRQAVPRERCMQAPEGCDFEFPAALINPWHSPAVVGQSKRSAIGRLPAPRRRRRLGHLWSRERPQRRSGAEPNELSACSRRHRLCCNKGGQTRCPTPCSDRSRFAFSAPTSDP